MVECLEASELIFEKLLAKLVDYKKLKPSVSDQAKFEFSHFVSTLVKENRDEFLDEFISKRTDWLDEFLLIYVG